MEAAEVEETEHTPEIPSEMAPPSGWTVRQLTDGAVLLRRTGWGRLNSKAGCLPYATILFSFVVGPLLVILAGVLHLYPREMFGQLMLFCMFGCPILLFGYILVWVFFGQEDLIIRPAGVEFKQSLLSGGKRQYWVSPGEIHVKTSLTTPRRHRPDVVTRLIFKGKEGGLTLDSRVRAMTDEEFHNRFQRPEDHPEMEQLAEYMSAITGWMIVRGL
jgi:hypothetical protein